ncbi:hypothetical protein HPB47_026495 [Ixodes persulcatus]|uniref:Uncharacterized protein n=1 Tax=Ixodes persulcatus TaxID=34615 RepID=A0AC60Q025_IXOPE|nr:hypothetical protein HPB47_026495 [Ixodes persulcatus]
MATRNAKRDEEQKQDILRRLAWATADAKFHEDYDDRVSDSQFYSGASLRIKRENFDKEKFLDYRDYFDEKKELMALKSRLETSAGTGPVNGYSGRPTSTSSSPSSQDESSCSNSCSSDSESSSSRTTISRATTSRTSDENGNEQPAARTSGVALQGGLLTQPLPTNKRGVLPFRCPNGHRENRRCTGVQSHQALRPGVGIEEMAGIADAQSIEQPAARTSGVALQGGLLTQPLPTTKRGVLPFRCPNGHRENRRCTGVQSHQALRPGVGIEEMAGIADAQSIEQPAARTSGVALQGGLLTEPLPTTKRGVLRRATSWNPEYHVTRAALLWRPCCRRNTRIKGLRYSAP